MSHFTKVRTRLKDERTLKAALERMGYEVLDSGRGVNGWLRQKATASFKIRPTSSSHEIGFVRSDQGFAVVADWWGIRGLSEKDFTAALTQQYAVAAALETYESKGYDVEEEQTLTGGEVRLVLKRVAGV